MASDEIRCEVAYALAEEQFLIPVRLAPGATVAEAIRASGLLERRPEIDLEKSRLGIFSKPVKADRELQDGDRVEIYRPLIADPKAVRKQRAAAGKGMKKGGGEAEAEPQGGE